MRVPIRSSIAGIEYWDTEEKRSITVPHGEEPDFEFVENPSSLVTEGKQVIGFDHSKKEFIGIDVSDQKDLSVNPKDEILDSEGNTGEDLNGEGMADTSQEPIEETDDELEKMSVKKLREFAKKQEIDIPNAVRAKGDIIEIIREAK